MIETFLRNYDGEFGFNYSVHISEKLHFIYFNNPKAGCTSTKATLNTVCARRDGKSIIYESIADIHDRQHNILLTPLEVGYRQFIDMVADESVLKFCILRDPFARTMSAYLSKILWDTPQKRNLSTHLNREGSSKFTFDEFVDLICSDTHLRDFDEHWRLQCRQVSMELVDYTFIGCQERLEDSLRTVFSHLGIDPDEEIYDVRKYFRGNTTECHQKLKGISDTANAKIARAYAADVVAHQKVLGGWQK